MINRSNLKAGDVIKATDPNRGTIICLVTGKRSNGKIYLEYLNTEKSGKQCWIFDDEHHNSIDIELITDEKEKLIYLLKY